VSYDPIRHINRGVRPELVFRPFFDGNVLIPTPQNDPVPRLQNIPNSPEESIIPDSPTNPDLQVQLQNLPTNQNPQILNEAAYPFLSLQNAQTFPQLQNVLQNLHIDNVYPGPLQQNFPQLQNTFIPQQQINPSLQSLSYPFLQTSPIFPNLQFGTRPPPIFESSIQDSFNLNPNLVSNIPIQQQPFQIGFPQPQIAQTTVPIQPNNYLLFNNFVPNQQNSVASFISDLNNQQNINFPISNLQPNPYSPLNFPSPNQLENLISRANTQNIFPNYPLLPNFALQNTILKNELQNRVLFPPLNYVNYLTQLLQIQNFLNSNSGSFSGLPSPLLSLLIQENYKNQLFFANNF
jgi:hypothetical protein